MGSSPTAPSSDTSVSPYTAGGSDAKCASASSRPRPPLAPAARDDAMLFSRPQVIHTGTGSLGGGLKFAQGSGTARRSRSSSHRLEPLDPLETEQKLLGVAGSIAPGGAPNAVASVS